MTTDMNSATGGADASAKRVIVMDRNDMSTYPMETFSNLLQRAKELEVPGA